MRRDWRSRAGGIVWVSMAGAGRTGSRKGERYKYLDNSLAVPSLQNLQGLYGKTNVSVL